VWSNGLLRLTAAGTIPVGTWTHLAITRAGNTLTVYVNGASVGTATEPGAFSWSTCPYLIGVDADTGCTGALNGNFPGQLDEFRLYNRALNATEIGAAMNAPLPTP
jgi:Concanavalin A-like lectin/glucanases superfamily